MCSSDLKQIAERIKKERVKAKSEAYHKAKADGSNHELVAAVEDLLGKPKAATPNVESWNYKRTFTFILEN